MGARKLAAIVSGDSALAEEAIDPSSLEGASIVMLDADEEYNDAVRAALSACGVRSWDEARCLQIDLHPLAVADGRAVFLTTADVPAPVDGSHASIPVGPASAPGRGPALPSGRRVRRAFGLRRRDACR